jgi:hypothetical protein
MSATYDRELEDELELETEDESLAGSIREGELEDEHELEDEYEAEEELEGAFEDEFSHELMGEFEDEYQVEGEDEFEIEGEDEFEIEGEDEAFFGGLAKLAGSLLGEGEEEWETEDEAEYFFKRVGRFLKRHSGVLRKIAKVAGPMIATAVGGPAAGAAARLLTRQLEGEFEDEMEAELEEMATAPITPTQAYAEYLAAKAATSESESEAEAFAGSAITISLTPRDRRRLETALPHLVRGASVLTRLLYRNPGSRQAVRLVPGIVASAGQTLGRHPAAGAVRPADVAAVLSGVTRRVLTDPRWQAGAARRHARGLAQVHRRRRHSPYGRRPYGGRSLTIKRRPVHVHAVSRNARVTRPRPGFVRVVTPVRVPPRGGHPGRVVRVVSDVKVPRGAVPVGRPASLAGTRR